MLFLPWPGFVVVHDDDRVQPAVISLCTAAWKSGGDSEV